MENLDNKTKDMLKAAKKVGLTEVERGAMRATLSSYIGTHPVSVAPRISPWTYIWTLSGVVVLLIIAGRSWVMTPESALDSIKSGEVRELKIMSVPADTGLNTETSMVAPTSDATSTSTTTDAVVTPSDTKATTSIKTNTTNTATSAVPVLPSGQI